VPGDQEQGDVSAEVLAAVQRSRLDLMQGLIDKAIAGFEAVLEARPDLAAVRSDYAAALMRKSRLTQDDTLGERSLEHQRRAVAEDPTNTVTLEQLLNFLATMGKTQEQVEVAAEWMKRQPGEIAAVHAHALALQQACRISEARGAFEAACARWPEDYELASGRANLSNYDDTPTPVERFELHRVAGRLLERVDVTPRHTNSREAGRKIRVAFLSGDLRLHSVSFFLEPLLEQIDRANFEVYLYHTSELEDEVTARLKRLAKGYRRAGAGTGGGGEGLGFKFWNDRIDVLVELSGHTAGSRLGVLAGRPCPVQMTYLGYPNTTGLSRVGYRLVDSNTDPAGSEGLASEVLLRLDPCFLTYRARPGTPEPAAEPPCVRTGVVTFGSANNPVKISPATLSLWAGVLRAVAGSRLVVKSGQFKQDWTVREFIRRMTEAGLPMERVTLSGGHGSHADHMASYGEIDIALDTVPYNGTTTTCDALWMGVPMVGLMGDWHGARVGATLLRAVGLEDLVARNSVEYAELATGLARNVERLRELRRSLRGRVSNGPLGDAAGFARRFESAVVRAYQGWCQSPVN